MNPATSSVILCLAYVIGLLSTAFAWGGYALLALGVLAAVVLQRFWRKGPKWWIWLMAGIVALMASLYFQARVPKPAANDISRESRAIEQLVTVRGRVESMPRLTRSGKAQFWLTATQLDEVIGKDGPVNQGKDVTGKLYVTVPLLQATDLHPNIRVAVTGKLYKPKLATNPGGFDFRSYLAQEGAFAGLAGRKVNPLDEETGLKFGWWTVRSRIIRSQTGGLGVPEGPLVSAMVMGSQSVNLYLSAAIKDRFSKIGLAHAFAASGFQVSLILGFVLWGTRKLSARSQFICGVTALAIFVGLTGPQAPILRAVVMGTAGLIAPLVQRKIMPLGSLLFAATLLLLLNPLWIWDLSFELSFLAVLGLLVTAPAIVKWLDWMPPLLASVIAIPIAASIWTLPLQLYVFKVVSPYSILVNIITTLQVTFISIGGFISAIAAVFWPTAGTALAWLLYYPTHWLILLVQFFCQLPGNSVAVGAISKVQLVSLYILIGLVWLIPWWQRRWWFAGLAAISLVIVPVWQTQTSLFQITVLEAGKEPILVIQDRGKVTLVNSGDADTANYIVLPFLRQQGVNKVDWAIATDTKPDSKTGWPVILGNLPIANFYNNPHQQASESAGQEILEKVVQARQGTYQPLTTGQIVPIGSTLFRLINAEVPMLQFLIQGKNWFFLGSLKPDEQRRLVFTEKWPSAEVLWVSGERISAELLKVVEPKVAIASSDKVDLETQANVNKAKIRLFVTGKDGAIQWTPSGNFDTTLELTEGNASLL